MGAPPTVHPTDRTLADYGLGKLDDARAESVDAHLESCADCRRRAAGMTSDSFLNRFRAGQSSAGPAPASPIPEDTLPPELSAHDDYEVLRELGRGGMGVVYLVHNRLMGRDEVLKVMGRHLVERPGVADRFLREIRAVARLRHANIVAAHHAFRLGGGIAFTMEYVDGYDLAKMVKARGPLPVPHACLFAQQAALGLQHAHEEGLVHRDIKPGNLMVARRGQKAVVKVLDFGLAKAIREGEFDGGLTHAGQMLGTPDFIAPEQISDAQSADIRADIYSLGCTLYYLLSGAPPFRGASLYDLLQAHHSMDARPLNLARPEVPVELAALIGKMMAKDPGRRFQTPGEVAEALAPFTKKGVAVRPAASDVSRSDRPAAPARPASTEPGPSARAAVPPTQPEAPAPEAMWASLIDVRDEDRPTGEAVLKRTASAPPRKPPWLSMPVIAGGALFGVVALGIIITLTLRKDGFDLSVRKDNEAAKTDIVATPGGPKPAPGAVGDPAKTAGAARVPDPAPAPAAEPPAPPDPNVAVLAMLDRPFPMKYPGETPLRIVLADIRKATKGPDDSGIPIYVDPIGLQEAEKTMESPIAIDLEGPPLRITLTHALKQLGLDYRVEDGVVHISDTESIAAPRSDSTAVGCDGTPATRAILAKLATKVPMNYTEFTPLDRVVGDIKKAVSGSNPASFPLYVDPNGLNEAEKTMQSPVALELQGIPLRVTLRLLLRQLGMGYYVKDGVVTISDWESVENALKAAPKVEAKDRSAAAGVAPAPPPASPSQASWRPLFNGKDLAGWVAYSDRGVQGVGAEGGAGIEGIWSVKDGILHGSGGPSLLFTPRGDYKNFRVRAEVKINDGGNSGLYFRAPTGPGFSRGYEAQINSTHRDPNKTGSLYRPPLPAIPVSPSPVPAGVWFLLEAEAVGNRIRVLVDGRPCVDWTDDKWTNSEGHFAIQCHDFQTHVQVRKLEVMELDAAGQPLDARREDGFRPLFNGRDLQGWSVDGDDRSGWSVEGGDLVARGGNYRTRNYLLTDRKYADFALRLEFRPEKGAGGGLTVRAIPGERLPLPTSTIFDHPLLKLIESPGREETGTTYWMRNETNVKPLRPAPMKPIGDWNLLEVEVQGHTLRASVNGTQIVSTATDPGATFPNGVVPALNRIDGRIGLQKHTGTIRFRNIAIRELDPGRPASNVGRPAASVAEPPKPPARKPVILSGTWRIDGKDLVQADTEADPRSVLLLGDSPLSEYDFAFKAMIEGGAEGFIAYVHHRNEKEQVCLYVGDDGRSHNHMTFPSRARPAGDARGNRVRSVTGHWYDVRFRVRGPEILCTVDGQEWARCNDSLLTQGRIGLGTWKTRVRFRDIKVTTPDGKTIWDGLPELPEGRASAGPAAVKPPPAASASLTPEERMVVGRWTGRPNTPNFFEVRADHRVYTPKGEVSGTWAIDPPILAFRWPASSAPGGAWVDELLMMPDGTTWSGKNQVGRKVTFFKIKDN